MRLFISTVISFFITINIFSQPKTVIFSHVDVIDGTGHPAKRNMDIAFQNGKIVSIKKNTKKDTGDTNALDMTGKIIMPVMTNAHAHIGLIKGTTNSGKNFTRENIIKELERYEAYGVGTILSMGSDLELIYQLRDSSRAGKIPGASIYTAGYGFRSPTRTGQPESDTEKFFRPTTPEQAADAVRQLVPRKPDVIKMWVDDFGGTTEKMKPEIYRAIIAEAHKNGIRVAAHVYYLEDAHRLLDAGVDIFAHSIRDQEIDDALIAKMKTKGTIYIPTLTRDGYEIFYAKLPPWINDPFFKASLEPGVYEMITQEDYRNRIANSAQFQKNTDAYNTALRNLKKVHDAGIVVALGTDSGAFPVRAEGFSEHLELKLMVDAGLTPIQVLTIATKNAATALKIQQDQGTLEPGKKADFIVLTADPSQDIQATHNIHSVWKNGILVNHGPVTLK